MHKKLPHKWRTLHPLPGQASPWSENAPKNYCLATAQPSTCHQCSNPLLDFPVDCVPTRGGEGDEGGGE